jgi:oligogalacturonide transporter
MTFARKAAQAAAVIGAGLVLQWGGFVPSASAQSAGATMTIITVLSLGTSVLLLLGLLASRGFILNERTHGVLLTEIQRFRAGGDPRGGHPQGRDLQGAPAAHRAVLEALTGMPYERLWGRRRRS